MNFFSPHWLLETTQIWGKEFPGSMFSWCLGTPLFSCVTSVSMPCVCFETARLHPPRASASPKILKTSHCSAGLQTGCSAGVLARARPSFSTPPIKPTESIGLNPRKTLFDLFPYFPNPPDESAELPQGPAHRKSIHTMQQIDARRPQKCCRLIREAANSFPAESKPRGTTSARAPRPAVSVKSLQPRAAQGAELERTQ
jgi:hypothetical protein